METLCQRYYTDLKLSGKSPRTVEIYQKHLSKLEHYYNKAPDQINQEELRDYLLYMKDVKHYSEAFFKQAISAFRSFYQLTLNRKWKTLNFIKPKKEHKLPDVLSRSEVKLILSHIRIPRYYAIVFTLYSLGLRISEGTRLTIHDIDKSRMLVHVRCGKGAKDRYVPLPERTYRVLRWYWAKHKNPLLLFPAPGRGENLSSHTTRPMPLSSIQMVLRQVTRQAGIKKWVHPQTLRHSYATHLLEAGVHLRLIQEYLGHTSPKTTARYAHLTPYAHKSAQTAINQLMADL